MTDPPDAFVALRGEFPPVTLNARRIASSLDVPGCNRRAVLDAAVDMDKLARLLIGEGNRQSPFAITRGNQFEEQVTADIDDQADPDKVSEALRQSAVYLLSVQTLAVELGFGPDAVSTTVLMIVPNNLSFIPVGQPADVAMQVARLRRQIAAAPNVVSILESLPDGLTLPALPGKHAPAMEVGQAQSVAADVVAAIAARFGDGCTGCPMFKVCRGEAERHGLVSRLGNDVASSCGSVTTIQRALALANGNAIGRTEAERALAEVLTRGAAAAQLFRAANG